MLCDKAAASRQGVLGSPGGGAQGSSRGGSGYSERLRPLRRMTSPYSTPTTPAKAIRARKRCIGVSPGVMKHRLCPTGGEACWREDIPNLVLLQLDFLEVT